ncbi:hypothetical protein D3C80_932630 [compost metagenome]
MFRTRQILPISLEIGKICRPPGKKCCLQGADIPRRPRFCASIQRSCIARSALRDSTASRRALSQATIWAPRAR